MKYRRLGKTGLMVSEIGFGGEWMERHNYEECKAAIDRADELGINILDCWMSEPNVRTNLGKALAGRRQRWLIQGHIGSTWQQGQYVRSRKVEECREAFEDLLVRLQTDYIDLGMIHFIDEESDFETAVNGPFLEYVKELKESGKIRHIGMSTHNPAMAKKAVESGLVEMILFSVNPAFDLLPPTDNIDNYFVDEYQDGLNGIDPARAELYKLCEQNDVGITVMKAFGGGDLLKEELSPAGRELTAFQCLSYALDRPAVASVMVGARTLEDLRASVGYESASAEERDYGAALSALPKISWEGHCMYCGHCAPCPQGIDVASVTRFLNLAVAQGEVPETVREHYGLLAHQAHECIACGACEKRCPFHVAVIQNMKKAAELFPHT